MTPRELFRPLPPFLRALALARPAICPMAPLAAAIGRPRSLLDLGCGGGAILGQMLIAARPRRALGSDINRRHVAAAARVAEVARPLVAGADYQARRIDTPHDWPDERFDCVLLVDVLHHVPPRERRAMVAGAADRLAPGGRLVVKEMAPRPWHGALGNRLHDLVLTGEWVRYQPMEEVAAWARAAGLAADPRQHYRRLWYYHELQVFHAPPAAA